MAANRWKWVAAVICITSVSAAALAVTPEAAAQTGTAISAADGRKVLFDGEHDIVVQDAQGKVVRALELVEFLPPAYVRALPTGEGKLQWRREAKFADGQERVEFSVPMPGSAAGATGPALSFTIDLGDGRVRTAQIREYLAAVDAARALEKDRAVAAR
jgi:hypothetical protein